MLGIRFVIERFVAMLNAVSGSIVRVIEYRRLDFDPIAHLERKSTMLILLFIALSRDGLIPNSIKYRNIGDARAADSYQFDGKRSDRISTLSVCPLTPIQ